MRAANLAFWEAVDGMLTALVQRIRVDPDNPANEVDLDDDRVGDEIVVPPNVKRQVDDYRDLKAEGRDVLILDPPPGGWPL